MKYRTGHVFLLTLLLLLLANNSKAQTKSIVIPVSIYSDILADYQSFIDGRNPIDIHDYSGLKSRRDVIEVVLFQQALALGGLDATLEMKVIPTYLRTQAEIRSGMVAATTTTLWLSDLEHIKNDIYITEPLIKNGMFEAGLYTSFKNKIALAATDLKKVQQLTAVSNKNWKSDWNTLEGLHLKKITHVQHWEIMTKIVGQMRADFLLAPFQPTKGMYLTVNDIHLRPITGIKVGLVGSRHFAVSKNHPLGKTIFNALTKGLRKLIANGTVEKAYIESGFFNQTAKDWKRIN